MSQRYHLAIVWTLVALGCLAPGGDTAAQVTSPNAPGQINAPAQTNTTGQSNAAARPLPPSILAELHRLQRTSVLTYHDTILGTDIARAHLNDSTDRSYADSALSIIDTAVTLSHKEWIDSELVEIPELTRFGNRVHFNYPASIMTETQLRSVPFDTSLVENMNPVTRENLPFFDQSPIPMPLTKPQPLEAFVELGGGSTYQPTGTAWFQQALGPRVALLGDLDYRAMHDLPVHTLAAVHGALDVSLGPDPADGPFHSSGLHLSLGYRSKLLTSAGDSGGTSASFDRAVSLFDARAAIGGDASEQFHYDFSLRDQEWSDALPFPISESSQDIAAGIRYDPFISHFRITAEATYQHAGQTNGPLADTLSPAISGSSLTVLFGRRKGEVIEWYFGAALLHGDDGRTTSTLLLPVVRVRVPLNPRWELGASFEPKETLASWNAITTTNPFFAGYGHDGSRGVTMDKINAAAFMNYALSPDDEFRVEARFITRQHEPVFGTRMLPDSQTMFFVNDTGDTRHIELSASGNFLLWDRDILTASARIATAEYLHSPDSIPFEPVLNIDAAYRFQSISNVLFPAVEFHTISRPGLVMNFLDAEVRWVVSKPVSILLRGENLLGSRSDFWQGYPECPQAVWASVKYTF